MEDVIFAGTSGRPPLGRAEVLLTIDNSDGALPIEYAEVTISRTMFRSGGSEYAINGTPCRLLDVQELLSDSGIGREMHVIVGQGQLDTILHATPEDRRGFIEEAAGVLKHRKRKEKALRKLDATDGNLTRLGDLLTEIRRQLKPLGRQAEVARQAATVQADVRDARARLMADDLVTARTALEQELADETILVERREEVEALMASSRERETALETSLRDDLPALSQAQDTWFALSGLRERLRGTQSLAAERLRNAASAEAEPAGVRPRPRARSRPRPRRCASRSRRSAPRSTTHRAALEEAVTSAAYGRGGGGRRGTPGGRAGPCRRRPPRGPGPAARPGQRAAHPRRRGRRRDRAAARRAPGGAWRGPSGRSASSPRWRPRSPASTPARRASTPSTRPRRALLDDISARLEKARDEVQRADRERSSLAARKEALEMGLNRRDGAGALLAATDQVSGLLGSVAALLSVRAGYETAVAAALGLGRRRGRRGRPRRGRRPRSATSRPTTSAARAWSSAGRPPTGSTTRRGPGLPGHASYAVDAVECPDELRAVAGAAAAQGRRRRRPRRRALAGRRPARRHRGDPRGRRARRRSRRRGGSSSQPSLLEIQAAVDEATGPAGGGDGAERAARVRHLPARERAARRPAARRRGAGQAARVRRDAGRRGRAARPVRLPGAGRRGPRPSASTPPSATPRPPATRTSPAWPTSSSG